MPALATTDELGEWLEQTLPATGRPALALAAVSAAAMRAAGDAAAAWTAETVPDDVKGVVLAAAARFLTNPTGVVTSERLGDYSVTRSAAGLLTDDELLTCRMAAGTPGFGSAMSVSLA